MHDITSQGRSAFLDLRRELASAAFRYVQGTYGCKLDTVVDHYLKACQVSDALGLERPRYPAIMQGEGEPTVPPRGNTDD